MTRNAPARIQSQHRKQDSESIFYELTRGICPTCRRFVDAQVHLRKNKV